MTQDIHCNIKAGEIDFKVEGPWKTGKYCQPPWLTDKKNFWILDSIEWLKQQHFDLSDNLLIVSALKFFLLFLLFLFFLFAMQKSEGAIGHRPLPPTTLQHEFDQVILLREELIIDLIYLLRTCAAYHHLSRHLSEARNFVELPNVNYKFSILHLLTSGIRTFQTAGDILDDFVTACKCIQFITANVYNDQ